MVVRSVSDVRRGALSPDDGATLAEAASVARSLRIPFVLVLASSGADVSGGVASLHGWGRAARAVAACSGVVPVIVVVTGPALSGPALLLGLADVVVMTGDAFAFVSGPAMVEDFTGIRIGVHQLGGSAIHARSSGLCAIEAASTEQAMEHVAHLLGLLPGHTDDLPPRVPTAGDRGAGDGAPGDHPRPGDQLLRRPSRWRPHWPTTVTSPNCGPVGPPSWSPRWPASTGGRSDSWPTSPRPWPGPWTSPRPRRVPGSSGSATPSTCRW